MYLILWNNKERVSYVTVNIVTECTEKKAKTPGTLNMYTFYSTQNERCTSVHLNAQGICGNVTRITKNLEKLVFKLIYHFTG